ncbi:MAG: hypothetical protein VYD19_00935 [Myxococcota bacterium]|nr:hypothetical protein [Myxococcota bacterium]
MFTTEALAQLTSRRSLSPPELGVHRARLLRCEGERDQVLLWAAEEALE